MIFFPHFMSSKGRIPSRIQGKKIGSSPLLKIYQIELRLDEHNEVNMESKYSSTFQICINPNYDKQINPGQST